LDSGNVLEFQTEEGKIQMTLMWVLIVATKRLIRGDFEAELAA
jgi:hypothetical protein